MLKVGITGGIASGKSTVSDLFHERHNVPVIDADRVAREVVEPGQPALEKIVERFGRSVLDASGNLDRRRLREQVFTNDRYRRELEAVLHPVIRATMLAQVAELRAPYCILAIPLLAEAGQRELVDRVLVIDTSEQLQLQRLRNRDTISLQQAKQILAAQTDRESRLAIADDVITNTESVEALIEQVDQLHEKYLHLTETL